MQLPQSIVGSISVGDVREVDLCDSAAAVFAEYSEYSSMSFFALAGVVSVDLSPVVLERAAMMAVA
jgi:hypothetical protein